MRFTRTILLVSLVALVAVPVALALRFTDESYFTPIGEVGKPYRHQFNGDSGCGPGLPYQYRILSGELPAGLTLSKEGLISGVPTQAGESRFWVELSDENPPSASWCVPKTAEREFTIKIIAALNVQQNSLAATYVNEPYSLQLTASGGGTQTWSIQSGTLPPGIAFGANGLLSGTPTTLGDYQFVVKVTDGTRVDTETLVLRVVQRLVATAPAAPAEVGIDLATTASATGGRGPYAWSLTSGSLPPGVTLDPATGAISGIPSAAGTFEATLTVKDSLGLTAQVNLSITVAAKLAIATKKLKPAKETKKFLGKVVTAGGFGKKAYKIRGKLPRGLRFNAKTGVISGKPVQTGTFKLTIEVTDELGAKAKVTLALKVLRQ